MIIGKSLVVYGEIEHYGTCCYREIAVAIEHFTVTAHTVGFNSLNIQYGFTVP